MKATCKNNPEHNRFITTATVLQEWIVNEWGNFVEEGATIDTVHEPDPDNEWYCLSCLMQDGIESHPEIDLEESYRPA